MFSFLTMVSSYRYLLLFLVAIPEGPVLAMVVGFLVHRGFLALIPAFVIIVLGDIIPDAVSYRFGKYIGRKRFEERYAARFPSLAKHRDLIERMWNTHYQKTVLLSKLAYGLSTPLLMSAGVVNVPFRKFLWSVTWIDLLTTVIFVSLGYVLGTAYAVALLYVDYAEIAAAILFLLFLGFFYLATKRARDELVNLEE